jgi:sugar phosphate isomerase/epimerase
MPPLATVLTFGFPDFHPPAILSLYRRAGCTVGQFYRNPNNQPALQDVKSICGDAGLAIDSIHGVFGDAYDPSSPDESVRRFAIDTYREEAAVALELGGPMVVVHPSPLLAMAPEDLNEAAEHEAPLRRSLEDLARAGEELGVVYLIENLPPNTWIGSDSIALGAMVRDIDSPHLRMCFDVGHAYINGAIANQLAGCADVIEYLHIHDNDGQEDSHLMPGDGHIDWSSVGENITRHAMNSPMMLEVFYLADRLESELSDGLGSRLADWLRI